MDFPNGLSDLALLESLYDLHSDFGLSLVALSEHEDEEAREIGGYHRRILTLVANLDRQQAYKSGGYADSAEWLSISYCFSLDEARRFVSAANALERFPEIARALEEGRLDFGQTIDTLADR